MSDLELISDKLHTRLMTLSKQALLNVLLDAIDEMQGYNGRSISECIHIAMQSECKEYDDGRRVYTIPSKKQIEKLHT